MVARHYEQISGSHWTLETAGSTDRCNSFGESVCWFRES
jgi:hypothetical protein